MPTFYIFDNINPKNNTITPFHIYNNIDEGKEAVMIFGNYTEYRIYKIKRAAINPNETLKLAPQDAVAFMTQGVNKPDFTTIEEMSEELTKFIDSELPDEDDLSEEEIKERKIYEKQLFEFLLDNSPIFYTKNYPAQCMEMNKLASNPQCMAILNSNWSFSSIFLRDMVIEPKKLLPKHTNNLDPIIYLNKLRTNLISKEERENLTMAAQQQIILQLLGTNAQGKINIPDELFNPTTRKIIKDDNWETFKKECDLKYSAVKAKVMNPTRHAPSWNNNNNNNNNNANRSSRLYTLLSLPEDRAATEQKAYVEKLFPLLSSEFFSKAPALQWQEVYALRTSENYLNVLMSNWQLSSIFLQKVAESAGEGAKAQLANSRLRQIFALNGMRRALIPDASVRMRTPIADQQAFVLDALAHHRPRAQPQQALVAMPLDHKRTVQINQDIDAGNIIVPDTQNLICPITLELLKNPVKVETKIQKAGKEEIVIHYFTKEALINSVIATKGLHPITRERLPLETVKAMPIDAAKAQEIEDFKNKNQNLTSIMSKKK